ncbi:unnamed protein product [Adineta steineri]|uniref:G-protein coupled receptors family 1 profile domain-containing protein n=1 Tax=Adineta steineri TaxID=433720 RepID=A0A814RYI1_9BILA|nr:unnamed protein product [Adineta steineri]CAF1368526.1 unnamed protein product [Adineta steineri]CAF3879032.1 unnamed protein product [Adineta steineri]CAF3890263.1 unnamed protein product [Adineta steineri]
MADPNQLYLIASGINRYGSFIVSSLGSIGTIINIVIFSTDKELKKTPCSPFFVASSISATILLFSALLTRFLDVFSLNLTYYYDGICKVYIFFLLGSFYSSALFTSFLSIERWLSSSRNATLRQFASIKNAYRTIIITITIVSIFCSQVFYCYMANQISPRGQCSPMNTVCGYVNDLIHLILFVIIPCSIMLIFGSLTLYNIKQNIHRVIPIQSLRTTQNDRRMMRIQSTITLMMFTQVCSLLLCNLSAGIQKIYSTITANDYKTPQRRAIESIIFSIVYLLGYVFVALPFYLYTLAGAAFREALFRRIQTIFRCHRMHQ